MKAEHAPRSQHPQPPQQGGLPQATPALPKDAGLSRRGDFEALLPIRSESAVPLLADGQLFAQLIQPVQQEADHSGLGGSAATLFPARPEGMAGELIDELTQRLLGQPTGPLNLTLLMPNLGRVQVRASKRDQQWDVDLGFERRELLERLHAQERTCERALSDALGQPVRLSMHDAVSV